MTVYYPRLKDLREDRDLTQQQIADMLNMKQSQYSRYERGIRDIAEGSRTHNGLKCHFCPSLRYLCREIRPVCPCTSALI